MRLLCLVFSKATCIRDSTSNRIAQSATESAEWPRDLQPYETVPRSRSNTTKIREDPRRRLKRLARPAMIADRNVRIQLHRQIQGGDHEIHFDRCKCHLIGVSALR